MITYIDLSAAIPHKVWADPDVDSKHTTNNCESAFICFITLNQQYLNVGYLGIPHYLWKKSRKRIEKQLHIRMDSRT